MNWWLLQLNKGIKRYDRDLFVKESHTGKAQVFRKQGFNKQYVMSLTQDWSANGIPVKWGLLPVIQRLKEIDVWNNEKLFEDMEREHEKDRESKARDRQNQNEDFARELRDSFKKTFNDVNTANLEKIDRRRVDDRRIKNGNC